MDGLCFSGAMILQVPLSVPLMLVSASENLISHRQPHPLSYNNQAQSLSTLALGEK